MSNSATGTITVRKMVEVYFKNDREKAAKAAGVSLQFLNNWISQNRRLMRLADGRFILETKTQKIISCPNVGGDISSEVDYCE